jgi:lipopolysaccharide export LptBFGC system permease protein LptF
MISRHIIFELSKATLISVSCLTILLLYGNLTRYEDVFIKAVQQNPTQVFHLCALLVPYALSMAIPFGFTVSLALVLGHWASNREILALNSLGASPRSLVWPFCLFSLLLSCLTIYATLQWGPLNRGEFDKLREKILWENLSLLLIEDGEISFDIDSGKDSKTSQSFAALISEGGGARVSRVSLSVKDFNENTWRNLRITLFDYENRIQMVLNSGKTMVTKSVEEGLLKLDLYEVDLEPVNRGSNFFRGGSDLFLNIAHWREPLIIEIGDGEKKNLKRMSFSELIDVIENSEKESEKIKAKSILHKNAALGFSPFFVCLLLLPVTSKSARREAIYNLFLGIIICVSFYMIGTLASNFFEKYSWQYITWWFPNVIFLISCLFFTVKSFI